MSNIDLKEYNYLLPEELIAQHPLQERDSSRLIIYRGGKISESHFSDIANHLSEESLLVFNNSRVIRARLLFRKETGSVVEILLLEPSSPSEYARSLSSCSGVEWICLIGNLKKWKGASISSTFGTGEKSFNLSAEKINRARDSFLVRFRWDNGKMNFADVLEASGHIPLPPYIKRMDEKEDAEKYQTIYSIVQGSVAAPTAGLHFTKNVFRSLEGRGIKKAELTLHVGAGTFQPVKSDDIFDHEMHTEHFFAGRHLIEELIRSRNQIFAVGTTSVRALESLYWAGIKLMKKPELQPGDLYLDQWEAYQLQGETERTDEVLYFMLSWMEKHKIEQVTIPTRLLIIPGYKFRIIDGMITNFHLPMSTLLLLVSAWTGENWRRIYDYAISNRFRFLSYGDSCLLLK